MSPIARQAKRAEDLPAFAARYAPPDEELAAALLAQAPREAAAEARIDTRATRLVEAIRAKSGGLGGIEDFLREYSLSTREGLALMVLAEALLRVPDSATADRLIEDKLSSGDWTHHEVKSTALLVSASAWALGISARIINPGETPENILESLGQAAGTSGGAHRHAAGDAAPRLAFRARAGHRGGARPRRRGNANSAIPTTCSAKARAPPMTPRAISRVTRTRFGRSAAPPAMRACRTGRASRSSSRRCIRATRRSRANGCCAS